MKWWYVPVILLDIYLLLSLAPWLALQVVNWLFQRSGRYLEAEDRRLTELTEAQREQMRVWAHDPRPGRYQEPDRLAQESLASLQQIIGQATRLFPALAAYQPVQVNPVAMLALRAWGPLVKAVAIWRDLSALRGLLDQGDDALLTLQEQRKISQDIPNRVRAALQESRAQARQLDVILEAEKQAGTQGLDDMEQRLQAAHAEIEQALDALAQAREEEQPAVIYEIDEMLKLTTPALDDIDHLLGLAASERARAENVVERLHSTLSLAEERWQGLQARGATEPSITRALSSLRSEADEVGVMAQERTLRAYQQINERVTRLDASLEELSSQLEVLDEAIGQSKEAIEGDVQALSETQAVCAELTRQDPLLDPDQSLAMIEKATELYTDAERQRGLGTFQGYKNALAQAQVALDLLVQAREITSSLPAKAQQARDLLADLSAEAIGEWRSRADRVKEELQYYARHWNTGLAGDSGEAISALDQVEIDLERISPNVRYQRRFRQSELVEAIETLSHAQSCMAQAQEMVTQLEEQREHIESLRETLEQALGKLTQQTLPAMAAQSEAMLAERQQRFETLQEELQKQLPIFGDPAQVNYDQAVNEWLPSILQPLQEIRAAHEADIQHFQELLQEALKRLDRQWTRLQKLAPHEQPGPEENVNKLLDDLDAWRAETEQNYDNPRKLRELVGRRVVNLEQRLETAQQQIIEGRRDLESLDRDYRRRAQAVRNLRGDIRDLQHANEWPNLTWDTAEAEKLWDKSVELERDSRAAPTLVKSNEQLQQALNLAQQAEQIYARVKHEMQTVLGRLEDELQAIRAALQRGERRIAQLSERGPSEELTAVEELCSSAEQTVGMARAAATFEDALRYLREARNLLTRS